MSQKKIIFLIILGVIALLLIGGMSYISNSKKTIKNTESLKIWITEWTTESYDKIIEWFQKYAPEYGKTTITIEKQTNDADRYRTLLLGTLTEWSGPDIFMLKSGEDAILETKIEWIPSSILDFSSFDKRYDDLFRWLIQEEWEWKEKQTLLKWVPLGYETLGVFYNKSLLREVPKTWNNIEALYQSSSQWKYPTNLGLNPIYTPNMVDILPLWINQDQKSDYKNLSSEWSNGLKEYLSFGDLKIQSSTEWGENIENTNTNNLISQIPIMREEKITTLDLFMRGEIGMIIGYPSLIIELEKANKRAGSDSSSTVILTDRIPQSGERVNKNTARYSYFGISKLTQNPNISIKFVEYLMTPEAQRLYMDSYPYMIPAQSEFYDSISNTSLSTTLSRAKIAPFIPKIGDSLSVFQYGLKSRFERYLREEIDNSWIIDTNEVLTKISQSIICEIGTSLGDKTTGDCQDE
jgi:ABC-type glycerol-3-phosphate transport system substrate-binding protein